MKKLDKIVFEICRDCKIDPPFSGLSDETLNRGPVSV